VHALALSLGGCESLGGALAYSVEALLFLGQEAHRCVTVVSGLVERTAKRLAAAQRERKSVHWWNRSSRAALEIQVAHDQAALERANEKREQLRQRAARRSRTLALGRERNGLAPSLRPEPARPLREREPPDRGLEL
jgi:predicted Holliday junction resolvase-like endonuclease